MAGGRHWLGIDLSLETLQTRVDMSDHPRLGILLQLLVQVVVLVLQLYILLHDSPVSLLAVLSLLALPSLKSMGGALLEHWLTLLPLLLLFQQDEHRRDHFIGAV